MLPPKSRSTRSDRAVPRKLYDDRVAMLPADVQAIIRKTGKAAHGRPNKRSPTTTSRPAHRRRQDRRGHAGGRQEDYKELRAKLNQVGGGARRRWSGTCPRSGPWKSIAGWNARRATS